MYPKGGEMMSRGRYGKVIYKNIIVEMVLAGESYTELAKLCGVNREAFGQKMSGKTTFTVPQATTLCDHYNKNFEYLFATEF
jgi:DNA-binding XRE family transcriptional regulator